VGLGLAVRRLLRRASTLPVSAPFADAAPQRHGGALSPHVLQPSKTNSAPAVTN